MTTTTYRVEGMTCDHCVHAITREISAIDGVHGVHVTLATGQVAVTSESPVAGRDDPRRGRRGRLRPRLTSSPPPDQPRRPAMTTTMTHQPPNTDGAPAEAATPEVCVLDIGGMTCAACVRRIEKALTRVDGVVDATVNLATEAATVHVRAGIPVDGLVGAVTRAGYTGRVRPAAGRPVDRPRRTPGG